VVLSSYVSTWAVEGCRLKFSARVVNGLVVLALVLFSISIFLPWVFEEGFNFTWNPGRLLPLRIDLRFWSFMAMQGGKTWQLDTFWFSEPMYAIPQYAPSNGLYLGWALVLVLQILTVIYQVVYVLNWKVSEKLREHHSVWFLLLPLLTIAIALYQLFVQHGIMYQDLGVNSIRPDVGFAIAFLSFMLLLVSVFRAPEQSHFKAIPKTFKRTLKKIWPILVLFSIVAMPLIAEAEIQSGVSKTMLVELRKDFQAIHENPSLWEPHNNRISMLAGLFRARIIINRPNYAYCELNVPVISYEVLIAVLNVLGYWAGEPSFARLFSE